MEKKYTWIGFDADDTLWENEHFFREAEDKFCDLLKNVMPESMLKDKLLQTEVNNLAIYGYGIKGFTLSLIEAAIEITEGELSSDIVSAIMNIGKEMLKHPVVLINGIEDILKYLNENGYKLVVVTKGDLLDQERKLKQSGLEKYFHHIEVVSDKKEEDYRKILHHLEINPKEFLMVGNSLKSDILPVLNIGGNAVHIPFYTTWEHELAEVEDGLENFWELKSINELRGILEQ